MNEIEITLAVITLILSIPATVFGLGYFRQGKNQAKLDEQQGKLNDQQEQLNSISLLKEEVKSLSNEVASLKQEVHNLREENENEKKKFVEAILAIQGKDGTMTEFIKAANSYMLTSSPVFERLTKYLDKQSF